MANRQAQIPGLYSSDKNIDWSNDGMNDEQNTSASQGMSSMEMTQRGQNNTSLRGGNPVSELRQEKEKLGLNFVNAHRLIDGEISRIEMGGSDLGTANPDVKQSEKIYVDLKVQKQHNLLGRLLGPKGVTLKRIQAETQTKMSILGRGSMRDKRREEELRNSSDPMYSHLKDHLHILIEANPPFSNVKLAAGIAEVRKMLIPLTPGMEDLVVAKFLDPVMAAGGGAGPPGGGYLNSREALLPPPMERGYGSREGHPGGHDRGRGGRGGMRGRGRGRGGDGGGRGSGGRGRGRGGRGRGGGGSGGSGGYARESFGGRDGGSGGGGPIRTRSSINYDRGADYMEDPAYSGGGGGGVSSGGVAGDYDTRVGYDDRAMGDGGSVGYRRSEVSNTVSDSDPYYGNFSDTQSRNYSVSRDYNHGSGDRQPDVGGGDWKSRREYRHHPYQQSAGYGY